MKIKGNDKASQTKCRFPNLGEMSVMAIFRQSLREHGRRIGCEGRLVSLLPPLLFWGCTRQEGWNSVNQGFPPIHVFFTSTPPSVISGAPEPKADDTQDSGVTLVSA